MIWNWQQPDWPHFTWHTGNASTLMASAVICP
ncbi:MAG: DUF4172 domain-containing protein [Acidobacteriaceae bacterium]|nr:DUF4172 domain-containing protein [Acidobacteriaceae bacterium]